MKITVPINIASGEDKKYVIEFDSDGIIGVGLHHGICEVPSDKPYIVREPDGTTVLSFKFERNEHAPKWIEVTDADTTP